MCACLIVTLITFLSPILENILQIIAEGANGPTTIEADQIFLKNNRLVIPVSQI